MEDRLVTSVVTVLTAIVGVAIIAVLVSQRANTAGVLTAGGNAFSNALTAAVSPVTGGGGNSPLGVGFGGVGNTFYQ